MKYIRIMRIDHWIKQLFIIPGCVFAMFLTSGKLTIECMYRFAIGFFATCMIASANYVINEWLDAEFDRFHPTKKNRSVVTEDISGRVVWILWGGAALIGFGLGWFVCKPFLYMEIWLWIMGILYNVKPFRVKDVAYLDVIAESVNNAIRLLMGWFIISDSTLPPSSIIFGYWTCGAFLMAIKRYAEYKMINDPELAGKYRKSFTYYSEYSLLISAFFYAMCSVFFIGIFLTKYRIELVLFMPFLIGLYCYYFHLAFKPDSAVQKPEKLFKEKGLMLYCFFLIIMLCLLAIVDVPGLDIFTTYQLVTF